MLVEVGGLVKGIRVDALLLSFLSLSSPPSFNRGKRRVIVCLVLSFFFFWVLASPPVLGGGMQFGFPSNEGVWTGVLTWIAVSHDLSLSLPSSGQTARSFSAWTMFFLAALKEGDIYRTSVAHAVAQKFTLTIPSRGSSFQSSAMLTGWISRRSRRRSTRWPRRQTTARYRSTRWPGAPSPSPTAASTAAFSARPSSTLLR